MKREMCVIGFGLVILGGFPVWFLCLVVPLLLAGAAPVLLLSLIGFWAFGSSLKSVTPVRALIVDDDELSIIPLMTALRGRTLQYTLAKSGAEMLKKLEKSKFDLIILDQKMKNMDAQEALFRGDLSFNFKDPISVIYFTASSDPISEIRYKNFSIVAVWRKSLSYLELNQKIDFMLTSYGAHA